MIESKRKSLSLNKRHSSQWNLATTQGISRDDSRETSRKLTITKDLFSIHSEVNFNVLKSINNLNVYNEKLIQNYINQKEKMPPKTKVKPKSKNNKFKGNNTKDPLQKSLLSYFQRKDTEVKKNEGCKTSDRKSMNTQNVPENKFTNSMIDLCDSSNSLDDHFTNKTIATNVNTSHLEDCSQKSTFDTESHEITRRISLDLSTSSENLFERQDVSSTSNNLNKSFGNNKRKVDFANSSNFKKSFESSFLINESSSSGFNKSSRDINRKIVTTNNLNQKPTRLFSGGRNRPKKVCPAFKLVKDTPFAVDAFCYGEIPEVEVYFLTHFHSDHYMGLNKSFNKPIFCTKITGDLCQQKLCVRLNCLNILEVGKTVDICRIKVTTVDANHCPGSVMFVFTLPCGKNILHCGDFRACDAMESYPVFWNTEIHTVYLDTTYCNPRYNFPTQSESINMALSILENKKLSMVQNGKHFSELLIVCGTYTIGKENFFMGIAKKFGIDVWASSDKNRILKVALGQDFSLKKQEHCQLHVLPMGKLQYNVLNDYLRNLGGGFTEVIAFKPSGWELSKGSLIQRGNVTIHGIPYSEHSSFPELQRFIKFLQPKHIIPTVPGHGGSDAMQKYFACWVGEGKQESQKKMSDYFNSEKK